MHYGVWMVCFGEERKEKRKEKKYRKEKKQVKPSQKTGT